MLNDLLFEIKCAEDIGYYKLADSLDQKLIKLASHSSVAKKIRKISDVLGVYFSPSNNQFIISVKSSTSNKTKRKIKEIAGSDKVSFKYSNKKEQEEADEEALEQFMHDIEKLTDEQLEEFKEFWGGKPSDRELQMIELDPESIKLYSTDFERPHKN